MGSELRSLILGDEYKDLLDEPVRAEEAPADVDALGVALVANLKAQLDIYANYLTAVNRQKMALVNRSLAEIQEGNQSSAGILTPLALLESERLSIMDAFLAALPGRREATAATLKCESIYPLLRSDLAASLKNHRESLLRVVEQIRQTLSTNAALVQNGSKVIHATVAIMTSVVGRTKTDKMNTYTSKGGVNLGRVQIRNLINRSV